jgi:ABC-type multidrug transport system ATPase subunit
MATYAEVVSTQIDDIEYSKESAIQEEEEVTAPVVSFENVSVVCFPSLVNRTKKIFVKETEGKQILNSVSGQVAGGLCGILGASGSGKTTLLNVLSQRLDPFRIVYSGTTKINGRDYNKSDLNNVSGYVMQDDVLHAEFTIQETLWYSAALRLVNSTSAFRQERIEEVLNLLGIAHRRNVIVGDTRHKGISGGERKRLCIAIELLRNPKLLFLDEPTSGFILFLLLIYYFL